MYSVIGLDEVLNVLEMKLTNAEEERDRQQQRLNDARKMERIFVLKSTLDEVIDKKLEMEVDAKKKNEDRLESLDFNLNDMISE